MGDHATINDPAANAPDAAFAEKGKGKAQNPTQGLGMDEDDSESESENEMVCLQCLQPLILHTDFMRVSRPTMVYPPPPPPHYLHGKVFRCHMRPATNDPT